MYNSLITNFVTKKSWIMRSTFKVLFYVNGSKEKNGIVPIMGRV
ncbi:MAG: site-specific integrase, partial [Bacteroidales bacterium]|nr:site-specific integrase [Bacteroidales bacterium]MEE0341016.1 site-specific integrase [Bacteroidales bacterium]